MIRSGFVRFNGLRGAPNETLEPPKQSRAKQNETNKKKHAPKHTKNQPQDQFIDAQAQHLLAQALYLGDPDSFNTTREDCVWKRGNGQDVCPDEDISIYLYTSGIVKDKFKVSLVVGVF